MRCLDTSKTKSQPSAPGSRIVALLIRPSLLAGDPIEAGAIASAFSTSHSHAPVIIGAVKSNIGHLEGACKFAAAHQHVIDW